MTSDSTCVAGLLRWPLSLPYGLRCLSVQGKGLLEKVVEGGAAVESLSDDQEGQNYLFIFSDCFHAWCQASLGGDSELSCLHCVSRQACAREGGIRGRVRNRTTWYRRWWHLYFVCCLDISSDPCFDERQDCFLGKKRKCISLFFFWRDVILEINTWSFCFWNAVSMHLLLVYFQSWSLGLVELKYRVPFSFFNRLFIKFYSSTPWWDFFKKTFMQRK